MRRGASGAIRLEQRTEVGAAAAGVQLTHIKQVQPPHKPSPTHAHHPCLQTGLARAAAFMQRAQQLQVGGAAGGGGEEEEGLTADSKRRVCIKGEGGGWGISEACL